jgi:hypothetical protein
MGNILAGPQVHEYSLMRYLQINLKIQNSNFKISLFYLLSSVICLTYLPLHAQNYTSVKKCFEENLAAWKEANDFIAREDYTQGLAALEALTQVSRSL